MVDYGKLLKHATNQMNKAMDAYAKQFDLTGMQMSIIDFVGQHEQVLQRDIETEFNIQRSTATVALQRMEARGLISRTIAADDARQKMVRLAPKAQALYHTVTAYIAQQQTAMTTAFTPAQRALFVQMLQYFTELNTP
ncbi:MarR family winged helix-turn-helix transcriptional regulator [Lacticaseibacillus baoqingensis]|uniref:MarR family winged helix-turn-helix transcriptional regulator n=1 Tax=Lacticaseibacillus baoqingensis TaxID=2486013 RepID=A0ABW4E3R3_9LACO|nr:MarR family winged helix-turn-helix transcriptional regulator [Lacticaseibacillus baoqingensis]